MACELLFGLCFFFFLNKEEYFVFSLHLGFGVFSSFFFCINKVICNIRKWTLSSLSFL